MGCNRLREHFIFVLDLVSALRSVSYDRNDFVVVAEDHGGICCCMAQGTARKVHISVRKSRMRSF